MESFSLKRVVSQIWGTQICCTICCFPMKSLHTKVNTVGVLADGDAIDRERERMSENLGHSWAPFYETSRLVERRPRMASERQ